MTPPPHLLLALPPLELENKYLRKGVGLLLSTAFHILNHPPTKTITRQKSLRVDCVINAQLRCPHITISADPIKEVLPVTAEKQRVVDKVTHN